MLRQADSLVGVRIFFFFQAEDGIRDKLVTGVQTCALPILIDDAHAVRVRYKDTDCMSVVYYGNYLTYFEVGRVEYLRQAGMTIAEINDKIGRASCRERV